MSKEQTTLWATQDKYGRTAYWCGKKPKSKQGLWFGELLAASDDEGSLGIFAQRVMPRNMKPNECVRVGSLHRLAEKTA